MDELQKTPSVWSGVKKLVSLLENKYKKTWINVLIFSLFTSFLESVTALAVMGFAQVLVQPESGARYLAKIHLTEISPGKTVFYMALLVGALFIFKSIVAVCESFFQQFCIQRMNYSFGKKMLQRYAGMDYKFYLTRNTSEWFSVISNDIEVVFSQSVSAIGFILSEGLIFVFLISLLMYSNPSLAINIFLAATIVFFLVKKSLLPRLYRWGKSKQLLDQIVSQNLLQFFHALKEVSILGKTDFFINIYSGYAKEQTRLTALSSASIIIPRLVIETLFVGLFVFSVAYLCFQNEAPQAIMGILGGYLYAGFRIMPGLNRMISQFGVFKSTLPSIEKVYTEYHQKFVSGQFLENNPRFTFTHDIALKNLSFSYLHSECKALKNISLEISKGEWIGIIGETGSGKSTLIDILLGVLRPDSGSILIDGAFPAACTQWHQKISYVPQQVYLLDDTIKANIAFGVNAEDINLDLVEKAIKIAQLTQLIEKLPQGINTQVGERGIRLSGGERQRIAVARALYRDAPVLILDEATSALDSDTENKLMSAVYDAQKNRTVIIIAHRVSTLKRCSKIIKIAGGEVESIKKYMDVVVLEG